MSPGDRVAFYMVRPLSSFVAVGEIASQPWPIRDRRDPWYGHHYARIREVRMLPEPIHLDKMRRAFPSWSYLRFVRRHAFVPVELSARFDRHFSAATRFLPQSPHVSAIEGLASEIRVILRSRSDRLRREALRNAHGICAACNSDFSKVLGGKGVRVLQVHHRRQIAASTAPRITSVKNLAVVCANCHALIHSNPRKALKVEVLARLFRTEPSNPPLQRTGSADR